MSAQVIERAPQTRCYKCGKTEIAGICHHCARAMCGEHFSTGESGTGALLTTEFSDLGLRDTKCGETPIHCEDCFHVVRAPSHALTRLGVIIALACLGGLALVILGSTVFAKQLPRNFLPVGLGFGALLLLGAGIGAGVAFLGFKLHERKFNQIKDTRPPLPVQPRFDPIRVREVLNGAITVDHEGKYHTKVSQVHGEMTVKANLAKPERDRLDLYRKKYKLDGTEDNSIHAGFVVLKGPAGLRFQDEQQDDSGSRLVLPLTSYLATQPFFSDGGGRGTNEWVNLRKYDVLAGEVAKQLPIRLIPSFVQESAQRALEIEFQWIEPTTQQVPLTIKRIDLFQVSVPIAWGEIENVTDNPVIGTTEATADGADAQRTITWKRPTLTDTDRRLCHHAFFVRFENNIESTGVLHGCFQVAFQGTLSRLENVNLYYPLGGGRDQEPADIETCVLAEFDLCLDGLRYQDVRVVPDPKLEQDREKQPTQTFEGVIPDHTTVVALTNAMSQQDFYIKRVIENPPRAGERANLFNRYWDIAGRRYLGVYPIDFHLLLTGEEVYGGDIRAQAGTTKTTLTVQGAFANPDMEARIENVWEQLQALIGDTLKQMPRALPPAAVSTQPAVEALASPSASGSALATPEITPTEPSVKEDQSNRVNALRRRLDQLTDALLAGRITEQTFLNLKVGIERELQSLGFEL